MRVIERKQNHLANLVRHTCATCGSVLEVAVTDCIKPAMGGAFAKMEGLRFSCPVCRAPQVLPLNAFDKPNNQPAKDYTVASDGLQVRNKRLMEQVKELRKALEPFALLASVHGVKDMLPDNELTSVKHAAGWQLTVGDIQAAERAFDNAKVL